MLIAGEAFDFDGGLGLDWNTMTVCVVAAACCDSLNLIAQALVCVCRFSCRSFALEIEISISIVMVFNLYDNHW